MDVLNCVNCSRAVPARRRKWLLEQSRNWIRADQLDARIEIALDNPEKLFVSGSAA